MAHRSHGALIRNARTSAALARQRGLMPILVVGQNAPPGFDPDGPAFPRNSAAGRRARRLWPIDPQLFESAVRVNAMPVDPCHLRTPLGTGTDRLNAVLDALHGDIHCVIAAGSWAAAVVSRVARLNAPLTWNAVTVSRQGLPLLAVGHPSGRNRAYNDAQFRIATARAVADLINGRSHQTRTAAS